MKQSQRKVIASDFLPCHCEERSDEAISSGEAIQPWPGQWGSLWKLQA